MSSDRVHRRLAAVWSADAAGYSRGISIDDAGTFAEMRTRRELLRSCVAGAGGRVVDAVGDNLLAEFPSAVAAVESAIAAQDTLAARDAGLPEPRRLPFRIGIHLGEVIVHGDALAGDALNVSARLAALAEPGGIWLSAAVSEQVRGKIHRALEDRGEHRLKNIASPVRAFRVAAEPRPAPAAPAPSSRATLPGLAVLPFQNLSGDPEQTYLADGIAEELLTLMARWAFPLVARQSSFAHRDQTRDVREIGRALGARYVVEGSIRRAGQRIRVTAQLIDAETGSHAWAENFDGELGDPLSLQQTLAGRVARSLFDGLSRAERLRALSRDPASPDAWDAFKRAEWHHNRGTREDWSESRRLLRLGVAMDPHFPFLQAALAVVEYVGVMNGWTQDRAQSLADGLAAARAAIALEPNVADVQLALGLACLHAGDPARARAAFERAVELDPGSPRRRAALGWLLVVIGRYDEAVRCLEEAGELGRRSGSGDSDLVCLDLARAHLGAGREAEALRWAEAALRRRDDPAARAVVACALAHSGRIDEAKREAKRLPERLCDVERRLAGQLQRPLLERILSGLRLAGMPD